MNSSSVISLVLSGLLSASSGAKEIPSTSGEIFKAGNGTFIYNGKPYVVKAAELHYPRIPKEYWDHRIKMAKALGMNTICLYVFWNYHESEPGKFDFEDEKDVRKFIELCKDNNMNVILRPGPYVCAEWEMGGLPWWLLKEDDINLRTYDPRFLERVEIFERRLAEELKGLTAPDGGPIIMVQVENEYGSYGEDKEYIAQISDLLKELYPGVSLFQCDWASNFTLNGLPDLIWTMNFGTGADIDSQFSELKRIRPQSPLMCSEYWSGWFDKWGANHETRPASAMIQGIEEILEKNISFSLYMTHGGTNFSHWAGANSPGFAPDVTSYDYDAPIDEQGRATEKYHQLREVMQKFSEDGELPSIPDTIPLTQISKVDLQFVSPIDSLWNEPVYDSIPGSMERYNQGFGMIKYSTRVPEEFESGCKLIFGPRDYARLFINGNYIGKLDRRIGENTISLPYLSKGDSLEIIVEAMGRINFGRAIKDFKGMAGDVEIIGKNKEVVLKDWKIQQMPDDFTAGSILYEHASSKNSLLIDSIGIRSLRDRYPSGLYKGTFEIHRNKKSEPIGDTFLDMTNWGKGQVWINEHGLGRFWEIGPQQTLYLPGVWMKEGENQIVILDILGPRETIVEGLLQPISDELQNFEISESDSFDIQILSDLTPWIVSKLKEKSGWQLLKGRKNIAGNKLILEIGESNRGLSAIAEIYLLDENGNRISRENWRSVYTSSADTSHNRIADKIFDLQESTYWESVDPGTQTIVIDLGENVEITGLEILPRPESGIPGLPSEIKVYIK